MTEELKPRIVISAVNLFQAGPLSIYRDALAALSRDFADRYQITALVHDRQLFELPAVEFLEYPKVRSSWLRRVKFEYCDSLKISRELNAFLWVSLHDMSPNVEAEIQAVYCHNPAPFASLRLRDVFHDWRYSLFVLFYRYLYRINIRKNNFVIVQQSWMRDRFRKMYGVNNIVVAHPRVETSCAYNQKISTPASSYREKFIALFPAFPRVFKNIELLIETARILQGEAIEIWLTFSGEESRYSRKLAYKAKDLSNIQLLGRLTREQVSERYDAADCMVFPSRLETWGLPISEFKRTGKPMLLADLPYAHETVGTYRDAHFFDPDDPRALALLMRALSLGSLPERATRAAAIVDPFAAGWRELFEILLQNCPPPDQNKPTR